MTLNLDKILFGAFKSPAFASAVDHYAGHEKLVLKSLETQKKFDGAFDITFDFEDGASIGQESALRELFYNISHSELNSYNKLGLRIHDPQSEHFSTDLDFAVKKCGKVISHLTIPKIENFKEAKKIVEQIEKLCKTNGVQVPPIHFLIETISAVREVYPIASLPHLRGLDFGCMDYVSSFNGAIHATAMHSPMQFEHALIVHAKLSIVEACIAHGIIPAHNVCVDYQDPQSAFNDALTAKNKFGFLRMWSIHPNQIAPILEAFAPENSEIQTACEILTEANKNDWAPISYKGRLHDRASYRYFWSILKQAKTLNLSLPDSTHEFFS